MKDQYKSRPSILQVRVMPESICESLQESYIVPPSNLCLYKFYLHGLIYAVVYSSFQAYQLFLFFLEMPPVICRLWCASPINHAFPKRLLTWHIYNAKKDIFPSIVFFTVSFWFTLPQLGFAKKVKTMPSIQLPTSNRGSARQVCRGFDHPNKSRLSSYDLLR